MVGRDRTRRRAPRPARRSAVRVRGVQIHDAAVERAEAGQRVAVNLVGVAVSELARGDVLASPQADLHPAYLLDGEFQFDREEPEHGERVQVHHGTRESPARLAWLGGPFWQVRLEQPLVAARGDRLVIRQIAPPDTLGGGVVLDPAPRKHGASRELLVRLRRLARGEEPDDGGRRAATRGCPGRCPASEPARCPAAAQPSALALEQRLREAGVEPPLDTELDPDDLGALRAAGRAVRVSRTLHYHPEVLADVQRRVIELAARRGGGVTLAEVRTELGTSRKFAQALLEHFDSERVTIRRGEQHVVRGRRT